MIVTTGNMFKLYKHQQKTVDENKPKLLLAHGMGTGKTVTALSLAEKNNTKPLIIVPKPVKMKWQKTADDMKVQCLVMTREEFRRDATKLEDYNAVIVDEVHYGFPTLKAQLHKKLRWYLQKHEVEYVWLLTGTPYTRDPWSIYGIATLLGYKWNYLDFRNSYFREQWYGSRSVWLPRDDIKDDVADLIRKIGDVVTLDDCFDVPEQVVEVEEFETTKEQDKALEKVKKEESDPIVRITKYHQIASGTKKGTEFTPHETYKSEKNNRIVEYCEYNDKVVVFSRYNLHLELLSQMLTKKKIPHAIINGKVSDKETILQEAEASDRYVLLINAMCSVGYELPSFGLVLFASLSYSFVDFTQSKGRVLRANALKKNLYVIMNTKDTVDEAVWSSIQRKQDFDEAIFSKETWSKQK